MSSEAMAGLGGVVVGIALATIFWVINMEDPVTLALGCKNGNVVTLDEKQYLCVLKEVETIYVEK